MQPGILGRAEPGTLSPPHSPRNGWLLVVVAASAHSAPGGSQDRQNRANDEQDDANGHENVGEGEGRDEAGQDEPEDDENNAENDHG